ncbi:uncharacterized protein LOC110172767 isoform X2 [Boleophthalmus pectinirostris]|nr:uncharacterized protein LOC110172767 isoform X2 [Boleophthalmus pectinirostris]
MDLAALCSFLVSLRVFPSRVQFFQYESVYLSCGDETNASEWTIMRNTTRHTNQKNPAQNKSSWYFNSNLYYRDAGVYWCQSEDGQCGAVVNITVTAGDVILESPPLPVTEGHTVTLRCIWNPDKPRTEGTFEFFKDGSCVGNSSSGNLTIPSASHSDSGLYTCSHQGALSAESPLHVLKTGQSPSPYSRSSSFGGKPPTALRRPGLRSRLLLRPHRRSYCCRGDGSNSSPPRLRLEEKEAERKRKTRHYLRQCRHRRDTSAEGTHRFENWRRLRVLLNPAAQLYVRGCTKPPRKHLREVGLQQTITPTQKDINHFGFVYAAKSFDCAALVLEILTILYR